jgi:hypothetical protein
MAECQTDNPSKKAAGHSAPSVTHQSGKPHIQGLHLSSLTLLEGIRRCTLDTRNLLGLDLEPVSGRILLKIAESVSTSASEKERFGTDQHLDLLNVTMVGQGSAIFKKHGGATTFFCAKTIESPGSVIAGEKTLIKAKVRT